MSEPEEDPILLKRRMEQMTTNFMWLVGKMDMIHLALCPNKLGTWQMRAEQAVAAAVALSTTPSGSTETKPKPADGA